MKIRVDEVENRARKAGLTRRLNWLSLGFVGALWGIVVISMRA